MTSSVPGTALPAPGPAALSISEVSARTGIPVAGLRNWEQRYGLPRPHRSPGGQRRYTDTDCDLLAEVLRQRAGGFSLPAAVARAISITGKGLEHSIFAGVRRQHPSLRVHTLSKAVLLGLSRAIEDECCARAQRPVIIGSFERQRYYRAAEPRWAELARGARQTVVLADFDRGRLLPGPLAEVPVPGDSPLLREWALVCDAADAPACVTGWELPRRNAARGQRRTFEVMWSVDPQVVRSAARIGISLAASAFPEITESLATRLRQDAAVSSPDVNRAGGVIERTLDYLAAMHSHSGRP